VATFDVHWQDSVLQQCHAQKEQTIQQMLDQVTQEYEVSSMIIERSSLELLLAYFVKNSWSVITKPMTIFSSAIVTAWHMM